MDQEIPTEEKYKTMGILVTCHVLNYINAKT